jgi:hypothetical protein
VVRDGVVDVLPRVGVVVSPRVVVVVGVVMPAACSRSVRTGVPLTTVMPALPQMHVSGNTSVRSASVKRRRAVIGVCSTSVRESVPYRPLEKLGAVPTCQSSCACAAAGSNRIIAIARND